jgi:hypothetical protein
MRSPARSRASEERMRGWSYGAASCRRERATGVAEKLWHRGDGKGDGGVARGCCCCSSESESKAEAGSMVGCGRGDAPGRHSDRPLDSVGGAPAAPRRR